MSFEGSYDPALQLLVPVGGCGRSIPRTHWTAPSRRQRVGGRTRRGLRPDLPRRRPAARSSRSAYCCQLKNTSADQSRRAARSHRYACPLWRSNGRVRCSMDSSTLSSADCASQGWHRLRCSYPSPDGRVRNGAYVGQWWLFAAFTLFMAFRMARDIGVRARRRWLRSHQSAQPSRHRLQAMRNAWIRYRIMAWLVGTLLVVLVCVGLPLKYLGGDDTVVLWTAIPHGYLYMLLLITAIDLGLRAKWSWKRLILIALAGTVPFLSFVAERSATKDVRAKLAAQSRNCGLSTDLLLNVALSILLGCGLSLSSFRRAQVASARSRSRPQCAPSHPSWRTR